MLLRLGEVLSLDFQGLPGIDGGYRRGTVDGGRVDVGQSVEGCRRGWVNHSSYRPGGSEVGTARYGFDLKRQPRPLGWWVLVCRHGVV